ncbi:MAG: hypothetical protein PWQ57_2819 [Desulfovibrionales bacterium]|jgi:HD-like signal output (HDOD) protein|nr:hypothetical protein [Desulfovibrionales bacterium]
MEQVQERMENIAQTRVRRRFANVGMDAPVPRALYQAALEREKRLGDDVWSPPEPTPISWAESAQIKAGQAPLGPLETIHERIRLPALPTVLLSLQELMEHPEAGSGDFARIISLDPRLSASVISLVNSPFYGLPVKVESLSKAIAILGVQRLSTLAMGVRLMSMFEDGAPKGISVRMFWVHSAATALMSHRLAVRLGKGNVESYFLAGQLHDLGRLPLFAARPKLAQAVLSLHRHWKAPLEAAERQLFDLDHAMLGGLFMKRWGLPEPWVRAALHHHHPGKCLGHEVSEVVCAANNIVTALGLGCNRYYDVSLGREFWAKLGVTGGDIRGLTLGFDDEVSTVLEAMFGSRPGMPPEQRAPSQ